MEEANNSESVKQQPIEEQKPIEVQTPNNEVPANTPAVKHNIGMAVVAYIIFFAPLLTDAKNDPFVKYHVKQGLVLLITSVIASIIFSFLPFYFLFIQQLLSLGLLVLFVIGIMNALNGKQAPLPLIGQFASRFKF